MSNYSEEYSFSSFSKLPFYKKINKRLLDLAKIEDQKSIVDLGCGTGTMLSYLSKEKGSVPYGIDLSRLNIYQCRKKMNNGHFFRQDIVKYLENTETKFDLVILYGVIGCFTVDQQRKIIEKISGIL